MRKFVNFISLASVILFLSCSNEESVDLTTPNVGELTATISFEESDSPLRAGSSAVPTTNWSNINTLQLFLYKADGTIAFSAEIDHAAVTGNTKEFTWTNVPEGLYTLALVANIDSRSQDVATSVDGGATLAWLNPSLVKGKVVNSQVGIDLKSTALPTTGHTFAASRKGYLPSAEVFTAYSTGVNIVEGSKTVLSGASALKLTREVSLMRLRIDKSNKPTASNLNLVDFGHANNFVAVQKLPVGIDFKLGSFEGGINATASDEDRIIIGAYGTGAYRDQNPTAGYSNPSTILTGNYTLWQEVCVYPNCTRADGKAINDDADAARRYTVIISGWVQNGYVYADGTSATGPQAVYWSGTVKRVFSPNVIREVNLNITTSGYSDLPDPEKEGGLEIAVELPEPWNNNIQYEDLDI